LNTAFILLPDFMLILLAWAINRYTSINQSIWDGVERLVYWVLFPCLLFNSAIHAKLTFADNFYMLALLAFCMCSMGLLAYAAKWLFAPDPINLISGIQTTFRFNTYIVLAVAARLVDASGLELMAITIACLVPISNTLSVYSLSHRSGLNVFLEIIKNPFVIATTSGLLLNYSGVHLPEMMTFNIARLGNASIPLGLLCVGASLRWISTKNDGVLVMYWTFLKLIAFPALALVGANFLDLPPHQKLNAVLFACMPTANSAFVLASRMGGNGSIVAVTISVMTLLAAITIPFWIYLAQ
jgi:malonate transporter